MELLGGGTVGVRELEPAAERLPATGHLLAVVACPGQEAERLGGVLDACRRRGVQVSVLALTRGEASPYNCTSTPLAAIRPFEFEMAGFELRASHMILADLPDGLRRVPLDRLAEVVACQAREVGAGFLITIRETARVVRRAARTLRIPAYELVEDGRGQVAISVDRAAQRRAIRAHHSQRERMQVRLGRLADQGNLEWLRPL